MRFSTAIMFLLVVGGIFFIMAEMVREANTNYATDINSSEWDTKYDYAARVNKSVAPIQARFQNIEDTDTGFFTKIALGITAIPYALITFVSVVLGAIPLGASLMTGTFTALGLPAYILLVVTIMLICWALFKLVEYWQRWQI
jgi:uncharacterized membrane protein YdjX (TVP38/TMEM64 family)